MTPEHRANPDQQTGADIRLMDAFLAKGELKAALKFIEARKEVAPAETDFWEEYLRLPRTQDLLERTIDRSQNTDVPYHETAFYALANLNPPIDFYRRPGVRAKAVSTVETFLNGRLPFDALRVIRDARMEAAGGIEFIDKRATQLGIANLAATDLRNARELADYFQQDLSSLPREMAVDAYRALIASGDFLRIKNFRKAFPQMTETDREEAEDRAIPQDRRMQIEDLVASESWYVISLWDLTEKTLSRAGEGAITVVFSRFGDPVDDDAMESVAVGRVIYGDFERQAHDAHERARRIQERFHLSQETFERRVLEGLPLRDDFTVERVRAIQRVIGGDADFNDRLERACASSILRNLFDREDSDQIARTREAFPFLTDAEFRSVGKSVMKRDFERGTVLRFPIVNGLLRDQGIEPVAWDEFPIAEIPLSLLVGTTDPELLDYARRKDPWFASLNALRGIQARAANPRHDPWILELFPLIERLVKEEYGLDRNSEKDGRLLVEYVTKFGMFDLPTISRIFFQLKRGPFASLFEEDRFSLVELIGPKAARLESPHLIHELGKLRFDFQRELLADKVPHKIGTALGEEAFAAIRGTSEWKSSDRPSELFSTWKETVSAARAEAVSLEQKAVQAIADGNEPEAWELYEQADAQREKIAVAPGYEEATFAVARTYRSKDGSASAEEEIERLVLYAKVHALYELEIASEIARFAARCPEWLAMPDESRSSVNRVPIDELRARLDEAGRYAPGISIPTESETESFFRPGGNDLLVTRMEAVVARTEDRILDRYLLALSAVHVANVAPTAWTRQLGEDRFDGHEDEIRERAAFLSQYLKEHYLNPTQDPEHTGHATFSEGLLRALERAWGASGDAKSNPLLKTNAAIEAVRAKQTRLSTDTVDVTLVPVRGPLSIYAGDVGNACYSKQDSAMARGEYQGVRAMIFVTNRNKSAERIAGSVLFVETRNERNERVLVVRANNPRENLVAQLDAASLVRQTVDVAIATARRRGIRYVAVVRDQAGGASSNRESVSAFYQREWKDAVPTLLANEPETNFNAYPIWDDADNHPSVTVWTNDDPEAT